MAGRYRNENIYGVKLPGSNPIYISRR